MKVFFTNVTLTLISLTLVLSSPMARSQAPPQQRIIFAVWAARRDFATAHPGLVKDVHEAFLRSRDLCLAELDEVATAAARWEPFDAATLASYFRVLDFSLGPRQVAGLCEFARRACLAGAVPPLPPDGPRFADV